jgi:hypothetical protein
MCGVSVMMTLSNKIEDLVGVTTRGGCHWTGGCMNKDASKSLFPYNRPISPNSLLPNLIDYTTDIKR